MNRNKTIGIIFVLSIVVGTLVTGIWFNSADACDDEPDYEVTYVTGKYLQLSRTKIQTIYVITPIGEFVMDTPLDTLVRLYQFEIISINDTVWIQNNQVVRWYPQ